MIVNFLQKNWFTLSLALTLIVVFVFVVFEANLLLWLSFTAFMWWLLGVCVSKMRLEHSNDKPDA